MVSGVKVVGAVIVFMVLVFAVYVMYGIIDEPFRETVSNIEEEADEAPDDIFGHVRGAWVICPVIIGVLLIVWLVMYIYRTEPEVGFR
jgi:ABC-type Fe3+-siderophore transport system permease subunit